MTPGPDPPNQEAIDPEASTSPTVPSASPTSKSASGCLPTSDRFQGTSLLQTKPGTCLERLNNYFLQNDGTFCQSLLKCQGRMTNVPVMPRPERRLGESLSQLAARRLPRSDSKSSIASSFMPGRRDRLATEAARKRAHAQHPGEYEKDQQWPPWILPTTGQQTLGQRVDYP